MDRSLVRGELGVRIGVALFFVGALAASACTKGVFVCHDDSQCLSAGKDGTCEPPGYCAFPDPACASGKRFGSHADMGLAHECTDEAGTTGDSTDPTVAEGTRGEDTSSNTMSSTSLTSSTTATSDEGPAPMCGNGIVEVGEDCDGDPVVGCNAVGFDAGELKCSDDCSFDESGCMACGNGIAETDEECDGTDLGGQSCARVGFFGGTLACTSDCTVDTSACNDCGNGIIDEGEVCDGDDPTPLSCLEVGFAGQGGVACNDACQLDVGMCGDLLCGNDPDATVDMCPAVCSDCSMGLCVIDCVGNGVCASDDIVCPEGWPCAVVCEGNNACSSATVTCPELYGCSMSCMGDGACSSAELDCSDAGSCFMTCTSGSNVCSSADVVCGHDECGSFCGVMLMNSELPTVECAMGGCVCGECLD